MLELFRVTSELDESQTEYWLDLLHTTKYLDGKQYDSLETDCKELVALLVAIIKKLKENQAKP